jgi:hypothetical protein
VEVEKILEDLKQAWSIHQRDGGRLEPLEGWAAALKSTIAAAEQRKTAAERDAARRLVADPTYQEMITEVAEARRRQLAAGTRDGTTPILALITANHEELLLLKMAEARNSICPHPKHDPQQIGIKAKPGSSGPISFGFTAFTGTSLNPG